MTEEQKATPDSSKENAKTPAEYLVRSVAYHIRDYKSKRDSNRNWAFILKMTSVVITAVTTVCIGLSTNALGEVFGFATYGTGLALILSSFVTVISSWQAFVGHDWKWVRYRATLAELYDLNDDVRMASLAAPLTPDQLSGFTEKMKTILRETNAEWERRREPNDKQAKAIQGTTG